MRAQALQLLDQLRASYWFIPSIMALGGVVLSFVMLYLDRSLSVWTWLRETDWLFLNQPTAARAVLQTIAASMITVAGVAFSITIATVANATIQFGPRLLINFMQSRGNQVTLGTFISTFVYCLLLLRTVRGQDGSAGIEMFVPNMGILGALVLAIASLANLIYFFHHIPESIHITNMTAGVGRQLIDQVNKLYPSKIGHARQEPNASFDQDQAIPGTLEGMGVVTSKEIGYVQNLDGDQLISCARTHDVVIYIVGRPGTFVSSGVPLALVRPAGNLTGSLQSAIRRSFGIGAKRTARQDILFSVQQLVDIAGRALSPGIQDPYTAIYCLFWMRTATIDLGARDMPSPYRLDRDNQVRLVAYPVTFAEFVEAAFGQLRAYAVRDRNVAVRMAEEFKIIVLALEHHEHREIVGHYMADFFDECEKSLSHTSDLQAVEKHLREAALNLTSGKPTLAYLRRESEEDAELAAENEEIQHVGA